jgi:hypothetical protein
MTNLHDIATVTAAYLRHNRIAAGEVPALISQIARTYQGLDGIPEAVAEKPQPAVSIRSSVKPDALTCLECGRTRPRRPIARELAPLRKSGSSGGSALARPVRVQQGRASRLRSRRADRETG